MSPVYVNMSLPIWIPGADVMWMFFITSSAITFVSSMFFSVNFRLDLFRILLSALHLGQFLVEYTIIVKAFFFLHLCSLTSFLFKRTAPHPVHFHQNLLILGFLLLFCFLYFYECNKVDFVDRSIGLFAFPTPVETAS